MTNMIKYIGVLSSSPESFLKPFRKTGILSAPSPSRIIVTMLYAKCLLNKRLTFVFLTGGGYHIPNGFSSIAPKGKTK